MKFTWEKIGTSTNYILTVKKSDFSSSNTLQLVCLGNDATLISGPIDIGTEFFWMINCPASGGTYCGPAPIGVKTPDGCFSYGQDMTGKPGYMSVKAAPEIMKELPQEKVISLIEIYNVSGMLIYSGKVNNNEFDVTSLNLKEDLYIMKTTFEDGEKSVEKMYILN